MVEGVAGAIGGLVDTLNSADPTVVSAITGGLTALAGLSPALLATEGAVKLVETLGVKGTLIVGAVTAIGALVGYVGELNEQYNQGLFGDVDLNSKEIQTYLNSQTTYFSLLSNLMAESDKSVEKSAEDMADNVSYLNEKMLTYVIGGANLSANQIEELKGLGDAIVGNVLTGIDSAKISSQKFFDTMFGTNSVEGAMVSGWMSGLQAEALGIGAELRDQMVAALLDHTLDGEEQEAINATIARLAAIEAQIQKRRSEADYQKSIFKAQNVSLDSATDFMANQRAAHEQNRADILDMYAAQYGDLMASWDYFTENPDASFYYNGQKTTMTDLLASGITRDTLYQNMQNALAAMYADEDAKYSDLSRIAFESIISGAGYGDAWSLLKQWDGVSNVALDGYTPEQIDALYAGFRGINEMYNGMSRIFGDDEAVADLMHIVETAQMAISGEMFSAGNTDGKHGVFTPVLDANGSVDQYATAAQYLLDGTNLHATVHLNTVMSGGNTNVTKNGYVDVDPRALGFYAEGGRATQASIFGEAGAEWAIPEEHSQRTADLLDAARAASGFTWDELIQRNGGLNAGGGSRVVLNYSPTVNANDAGEVETVLQRDKKNLRRMLEQMLEERNIGGSEAYV